MELKKNGLLFFFVLIPLIITRCVVNSLLVYGEEHIVSNELTISSAIEVERIKDNLAEAGLVRESVEGLLSVLPLKGKKAKQQGKRIIVSDSKGIQAGDYLVAGAFKVQGTGGHWDLLGILEYKEGYLKRLDLADLRTVFFTEGSTKNFKIVKWSMLGKRKYEAVYTNGHLKGSELHLYDFSVTFKYDQYGDLTQESLATLDLGSKVHTLTKHKGIGFSIKSVTTNKEETYSETGRKIFLDNASPATEERDEYQELIVSLPNYVSVKAYILKLLRSA